MAEVARTTSGTGSGNTVVLRRVKVFFQVYPGTGGTDAERGIGNASFRATINPAGTVIEGKTAADGGVELSVPAGASATVRIFDTDYPITVRTSLEPVGTTKGVQRRLSLLGYPLGAIDGVLGERTDLALLNLQADSDIDADGVIGPNSRNQVRTKFGE